MYVYIYIYSEPEVVEVNEQMAVGYFAMGSCMLVLGESHLSNATCLIHEFFKSGE